MLQRSQSWEVNATKSNKSRACECAKPESVCYDGRTMGFTRARSQTSNPTVPCTGDPEAVPFLSPLFSRTINASTYEAPEPAWLRYQQLTNCAGGHGPFFVADCWLTFTGVPRILCVQVCMLYDSGVRVSLAEGLGEQQPRSHAVFTKRRFIF